MLLDRLNCLIKSSWLATVNEDKYKSKINTFLTLYAEALEIIEYS